jgi:hypothetical protein
MLCFSCVLYLEYRAAVSRLYMPLFCSFRRGYLATGVMAAHPHGSGKQQPSPSKPRADPERNESEGTLMKTSIKTPEQGHLS